MDLVLLRDSAPPAGGNIDTRGTASIELVGLADLKIGRMHASRVVRVFHAEAGAISTRTITPPR